MLKTLIPAAAAIGLLFTGASANAMPLAGIDGGPAAHVTLVSDFCGPYRHRDPFGHCRPGPGFHPAFGYGYGRLCPPGFHRGPFGHRCFPN